MSDRDDLSEYGSGYAVLVISGVFKGALVRGPLLGRTARDFCNYFGIIFSAI